MEHYEVRRFDVVRDDPALRPRNPSYYYHSANSDFVGPQTRDLMTPPRFHFHCELLPLLLVYLGCTQTPSRLAQPTFDAEAGKAAIQKYDANSDGQIGGDELTKVPGVKSALARVDTNGDKQVSADEIDGRIASWRESKTAIMSVRLYFKIDGQPLSGAQVTLVPEGFLGDAVKPATATTNDSGQAIPYVSQKPEEQGVQPGFYRIEVSKMNGDKEFIPARYNSATELGMEAGPGSPEVFGVTIDLRSR